MQISAHRAQREPHGRAVRCGHRKFMLTNHKVFNYVRASTLYDCICLLYTVQVYARSSFARRQPAGGTITHPSTVPLLTSSISAVRRALLPGQPCGVKSQRCHSRVPRRAPCARTSERCPMSWALRTPARPHRRRRHCAPWSRLCRGLIHALAHCHHHPFSLTQGRQAQRNGVRAFHAEFLWAARAVKARPASEFGLAPPWPMAMALARRAGQEKTAVAEPGQVAKHRKARKSSKSHVRMSARQPQRCCRFRSPARQRYVCTR